MKSFRSDLALFLFELFLIFSSISARAELPTCTSQSQRGESCWANIAAIHPTQIPIGEIEVQNKLRLVRTYQDNPKKLAKFQMDNPSPAVVGPDGKFYIIDNHHLTSAFYLAGIEDSILDIWETFETLKNQEDFWKEMNRRQWVYLFDEKGEGPVPFTRIPDHIKDLKDDPFRSLASAVQEIGGFKKVEIPFVQFTWANFFRKRIEIDANNKSFKRAVSKGYKLARSTKAKGLPGYTGPKKVAFEEVEIGCWGSFNRFFGCSMD